VHAMKVHANNGCATPRVPNLGTRCQ